MAVTGRKITTKICSKRQNKVFFMFTANTRTLKGSEEGTG